MKRFVFILCICLTGCVTASVTKLTNNYYAPTAPDDVAIYLSASDIPGEYDEIALIYTKGDYQMTDESDQFEKAREKAAEVGANGILFGGMEEPKDGAKVANFVFGTKARRKGEMMAIFVYPEE